MRKSISTASFIALFLLSALGNTALATTFTVSAPGAGNQFFKNGTAWVPRGVVFVGLGNSPNTVVKSCVTPPARQANYTWWGNGTTVTPSTSGSTPTNSTSILFAGTGLGVAVGMSTGPSPPTGIAPWSLVFKVVSSGGNTTVSFNSVQSTTGIIANGTTVPFYAGIFQPAATSGSTVANSSTIVLGGTTTNITNGMSTGATPPANVPVGATVTNVSIGASTTTVTLSANTGSGSIPTGTAVNFFWTGTSQLSAANNLQNVNTVGFDISAWALDSTSPVYDPLYAGYVLSAISTARSLGLVVILEMNQRFSSGYCANEAIGTASHYYPINSLNAWQNLASQLPNDTGIILRLFKEPSNMSADCGTSQAADHYCYDFQLWASQYSAVIAQVRYSAAVANGGNGWAGIVSVDGMHNHLYPMSSSNNWPVDTLATPQIAYNCDCYLNAGQTFAFNNTATGYPGWTHYLQDVMSNHPFFISEFGACVKDTFNTTPITAMTWSSSGGGTVTATVASTANLSSGATINPQVGITGVTPSGYNGTPVITITSGTQFTYPLASNPGTVTVQGKQSSVSPSTVENDFFSGFLLGQTHYPGFMAFAFDIINTLFIPGNSETTTNWTGFTACPVSGTRSPIGQGSGADMMALIHNLSL